MNPTPKFPFIGSTPSLTPHLQKVIDGEYDIKWWQEAGTSDLTILDIGANLGSYSYWALNEFPRAKVIAYEPDAQHVQYYKENLEHCGLLGRATINHAAIVTSDVMEVTLYKGSVNSGMTSMFKNLAGQDKDSFVAPAFRAGRLPICNIMKLDMEGNEPNVLKQYFEEVRCYPAVISVEYHTEWDRLLIDDLLKHHYYLGAAHILWPNIGTLSYVRSDLLKL